MMLLLMAFGTLCTTESKLPLEKFEKFFYNFPFAFNVGSWGYI